MNRDDEDVDYDAEWFAALRRAADLIDEHPFLEPDVIVSALDDEFCGSVLLPSGDTALVRAVYGLFVETDRLRFSDIVEHAV
jgi:hypothetical protein